MAKCQSNNNPSAGNSSSSPRSIPPWIELPRELTLNILRRLDQSEILESVQDVCTTWRNISFEPSLWRVIKLEDYVKDASCRRAVDLSQGQMVDISIKHFATDELLRYISDRSILLKCLTLSFCRRVTPRGFMRAIQDFPYLEELHLLFLPSNFNVDMKTISVSCPLLKSFSFNKPFNVCNLKINNSQALFIAKNLPDLCSLSLIGNGMTNKGLEAILDGCPNLQSLDLHLCIYVEVDSEIGRRCLRQIKQVRFNTKDGSYHSYDYDYDYVVDFDDEYGF